MTEITKQVSDLIDNEYKEYSFYVIESRAVPSLVDGLKPVQRKTLYAALSHAREKKVKVSELAAKLPGYGYHHGDASAQDACIKMAQTWNNNYPLLESHGNFGSRLTHEAAAPRYIFVRLSKVFDQYFTDPEILPAREDDDESPEPLHYLPIVPWVLVNGVVGIAVGFATTILPRDLKTVARVTQKVMQGKSLTVEDIKPTFPDFEGTVDDDGYGRWVAVGIVDNPKDVDYVIRELPPGWDRVKYVEFLNKLEDNGDIKSYSDLCSGGKFHFRVKVTRKQKESIEKKGRLTFFRATKSFTENLTVIDERGKLRLFGNVEDLIQHFIEYRLQMYDKKIEFEIARHGDDLEFCRAKRSFVEMVIAGEIDFRNLSKSALRDWVSETLSVDSDKSERIIGTPIYSCTADKIKELTDRIEGLEYSLKEWENTDSRTYYANILKKVV